MAVVTMCFPFRFPSSRAARMAQLSPSVPQEVKTTSSARQPRAWATTARSAASRSAAAVPRAYRVEGLPKSRVITSRAAWAASGRTRVVAALSR